QVRQGLYHPAVKAAFLLITLHHRLPLIPFLATMLDIPELDDMICQQLNPHDLTQCARVSKKWHSLVIPRLWRDLSWMCPRFDYSTEAHAFSRMVLEDYLAEQRYQELQDVGQSMQARPFRPLSTLSKYGHRIRILPDPTCFQRFFAAEAEDIPSNEVLQYLFERCRPDVRVGFFGATIHNESFGLPAKIITDFTMPRVRHLFLNVFCGSPSAGITMLMGLLNQCSTTLETLELGIRTIYSEPEQPEHFMDEQTENESKSWTSLKELIILRCSDNTYTEVFLSWLLRRCGSVKRLGIRSGYGVGQSLAQSMLICLPDLYKISFGRDIGNDNTPDDRIATLLGGTRNGWRVVDVYPTAEFGEAAMNALSNHFATLEVLNIRRHDLSCDGPVRVLRSCTKLCALGDIGNDEPSIDHSYFQIDAKMFIDMDPVKGSLKPWECEGSLKTLKVVIVGIPRPDLKSENDIEEAYPGEGREIQSQVYDRLARLTNLETLWLGSSSNVRQVGGMEVSLEGGLYKLSGLKRLGELNVTCLRTRIGVKEVQWMVKNWPRLRIIHGLDGGDTQEALRWLQLARAPS
ncbi:MAG: hypothetical protein J3Q66DRAFT_58950, partial [Benniella sp.]